MTLTGTSITSTCGGFRGCFFAPRNYLKKHRAADTIEVGNAGGVLMRRKRQRKTAQAAAAYTEEDRTYDKAAKVVLGNRQMLAPVVQRVVPEFHDVSLEEIQGHYIDGEPQISTVPVAPGKTNRKRRRVPKYIRGRQTEDSVLGEGWITFDVLFYAKVPKSASASEEGFWN